MAAESMEKFHTPPCQVPRSSFYMAPRNKSEFTPSKRGRILALRDEGYTYEEIANKISGCSISGAWKTVKRDRVYHTRNSLPRTGRPPALDDRTCRRIISALRKNRFHPYKQIAQELGGVTEDQVRRAAHDKNYHRRVARPKPFIRPQNVPKRLAWAKENEGRDWGRIIWTDEATIETGERPTRPRVTRQPGEEYLPECIQPTFKSGRKTMMVWACITHGVKGPIIKLDMGPPVLDKSGKKKRNGLNVTKYVNQVLRGPLKDFKDRMEVETGSKMLIVEDGAPAHGRNPSKVVRAELGIKNLEHPPSSPDLNPIEPLWLILKNRVADIPGSANTLDALWAAVQQAWGEITEDDIKKHTGTMDERCRDVTAANGWHTRF